VSFTRRFWWTLPLTIIVTTLAMAGHYINGLPVIARTWIEMVMTIPIVFWAGWPFFVRWAESIRRRSPNMWTLIGTGVAAALVYSLAATVAPGLFPKGFEAHGRIGVYYEAAAVIVSLTCWDRCWSCEPARRPPPQSSPCWALLQRPHAASVATAGRRMSHSPTCILATCSACDRARRSRWTASSPTAAPAWTNPCSPVNLCRSRSRGGDRVIGATINGGGSLVMRAEKVGAQTVLSQIVQMVAQAQRSRAPMQRMADAVSYWFVLAVLAVAIVTLVVWGIFGPEPRWTYALLNAVAVLIIACPCALGLATPMSIMVATGRGATSGILFRDAEAIESLRTIDTLIVDKTGTLTVGKPAFHSIVAAPGFTEEEVLRLAASLDQASEHPLADTLVTEARRRNLQLSKAEDFQSGTGIGVRGRVDGKQVALGNTPLMEELGVDIDPLWSAAEDRRAQGASVVFVAADGLAAGLLAAADPIKESTPEAIRQLHDDGIRLVMATGDGLTTAQAVADQLGIDEVHGEVRPQDKVDLVAALQAKGRRVAMAGDGINDAPALARAQVGIAMGTGPDVAMNSGHVTLVKGDLRGIARACQLSRATVANMKQNLVFALIYNALGVPIAAGILYPAFGVLLSPLFAAAAMSLSSVSVVGNALRLRRS